MKATQFTGTHCVDGGRGSVRCKVGSERGQGEAVELQHGWRCACVQCVRRARDVLPGDFIRFPWGSSDPQQPRQIPCGFVRSPTVSSDSFGVRHTPDPLSLVSAPCGPPSTDLSQVGHHRVDGVPNQNSRSLRPRAEELGPPVIQVALLNGRGGSRVEHVAYLWSPTLRRMGKGRQLYRSEEASATSTYLPALGPPPRLPAPVRWHANPLPHFRDCISSPQPSPTPLSPPRAPS